MGKAICALVREFGFIAPAARSMGLSKLTVYSWRDRSDAGEPEFEGFAEELRKAQGHWEQGQLRQVTDPRWLLERADPETYGRPEPQTVVNVSQSQGLLSREEALAELKAAGLIVAETAGEETEG